jgi:hypothetical protein
MCFCVVLRYVFINAITQLYVTHYFLMGIGGRISKHSNIRFRYPFLTTYMLPACIANLFSFLAF